MEIREPTSQELPLYNDLRWRILRQPWTNEQRPEDHSDLTALHVTAWQNGRLLGGARCHFLSPGNAQIRGMAVEPDCAGQGVGSAILQGIEARAASAGVNRIILNARETAIDFYRKNGYQLGDETYTLFNTIRHWAMHKDL
jgi:N-acetylglutamate synthase-like GNAT family acetyltransferase